MKYPHMRRTDRQLSQEQVTAILERGTHGVLSTVDAEGQPYGVPVNYVFYQGAIYFHSAVDGHKLDNVQVNPHVSFCVIDKAELLPQQFSTDFASVIVFGEARMVEGEEKLQALTWLVEHLAPGQGQTSARYIEKNQEQTGIVKIEIAHLTGKGR